MFALYRLNSDSYAVLKGAKLAAIACLGTIDNVSMIINYVFAIFVVYSTASVAYR